MSFDPFVADAPGAFTPLPPDDPARAFAACLGSVRGKEAIAHLRRVFLERRLPPTASDAELWHLEGQRSVVAHIVALVERGRQSPTPDGADGSHG